MNHTLDRRALLRTGWALGACLALPTARACEFDTINFKLIHPWARATAPDATVAKVCMKFDQVTTTDRLVGVSTPVAEGAEMGGVGAGPAVDFIIPEGQLSVLSEMGTHVRLIGLKFPLETARSYPLTLVFEKAGPLQASLNIDYARFG